jgi:hypothetical protein
MEFWSLPAVLWKPEGPWLSWATRAEILRGVCRVVGDLHPAGRCLTNELDPSQVILLPQGQARLTQQVALHKSKSHRLRDVKWFALFAVQVLAAPTRCSRETDGDSASCDLKLKQLYPGVFESDSYLKFEDHSETISNILSNVSAESESGHDDSQHSGLVRELCELCIELWNLDAYAEGALVSAVEKLQSVTKQLNTLPAHVEGEHLAEFREVRANVESIPDWQVILLDTTFTDGGLEEDADEDTDTEDSSNLHGGVSDLRPSLSGAGESGLLSSREDDEGYCSDDSFMPMMPNELADDLATNTIQIDDSLHSMDTGMNS